MNPDTQAIQSISVPINQAAREKWDQRFRTDPNAGDEANQRHVNLVLPKFTYELKGFRYDATRKLPSINFRVAPTGQGASALVQLNPVPMLFEYVLNLQTRTLEDGWKILEQFVPFFKPDYTDNWDDTVTEKRTISWEFNFEARAHLYPPIVQKKVITDSILRFTSLNNTDIASPGTVSTMTVSVDPPSANIDEPFDIVIDTSNQPEDFDISSS